MRILFCVAIVIIVIIVGIITIPLLLDRWRDDTTVSIARPY
jgi:hypothetical protein